VIKRESMDKENIVPNTKIIPLNDIKASLYSHANVVNIKNNDPNNNINISSIKCTSLLFKK
jgi:hypothetical protein